MITLDKQFDKLPKKVEFCKNCVVSNQRPRTELNLQGICSACEWAFEKKNKVDWILREKELKQLLDKHRKSNGEFDVIVPSSGGKDSAFVAHQLKYKYNMNPICVTWMPAEWSHIGRTNLDNFAKKGFATKVALHNGSIHRKLCRLGFEFLGQPFAPFIYGQKAYPYHIANQLDIGLIMYGENGELEYGGSTKYKNLSQEPVSEWQEHYFKGTSVYKLIMMGYEKGLFNKKDVKFNQFKYYQLPDEEIIKKKKLKCIGILILKNGFPMRIIIMP